MAWHATGLINLDMNKTDNIADVGKHKFELAGLGRAPFTFKGVNENVITYPDGTSKAGGSCDYCGNGIRYEFVIDSSDGLRSKVGCNCIEKVGDKGILKAYKSSPEYRKAQQLKRQEKSRAVVAELKELIEGNREKLASLPHPRGFTDRNTGQPLTGLDQVEWLFENCGASGRASLLKSVKTMLA